MSYKYNVFTGKLDYYTTVSGGGGGGGVTDHGALTGLDDPADHTWALLVNGTRQLSADWNYGAQTISGTGDVQANSFKDDESNFTISWNAADSCIDFSF